MEASVNYAVKIANYAVVLERMTRKNRCGKNSKLRGPLNNYNTVPKGNFSPVILVLISRPFVYEAAHFRTK